MEGACVDSDSQGYLVYDNSRGWHYFSASNGERKSHPPDNIRRVPGGPDRGGDEAAFQHARAYGFTILILCAGILLAASILYILRCVNVG